MGIPHDIAVSHQISYAYLYFFSVNKPSASVGFYMLQDEYKTYRIHSWCSLSQTFGMLSSLLGQTHNLDSCRISYKFLAVGEGILDLNIQSLLLESYEDVFKIGINGIMNLLKVRLVQIVQSYYLPPH